MDTQNNGRIFAAEIVGTAVLMLGGPGTAIIASQYVGILGVAFGFGFSLMIMCYAIGPVSGCHINPAVTLGLFLAKKINSAHAVAAVLGQIIGAVGGFAIIYGVASGKDGFKRGQFAANLWSGPYFGLGSAIIVEVILTALLVLVVLFTTTKGFSPGFGGIAIGITLTVIHLISIPVDNTSVNPARSLGAALFAENSTGALQQLWAFIVFPLIGAAVGVVLFLMLDDSRVEDTLLAQVPGMTSARDALDTAATKAEDAID